MLHDAELSFVKEGKKMDIIIMSDSLYLYKSLRVRHAAKKMNADSEISNKNRTLAPPAPMSKDSTHKNLKSEKKKKTSYSSLSIVVVEREREREGRTCCNPSYCGI